MSRSSYLELAARGHRFPLATDLTLAESPDPEAVRLDGDRLGEVVAQTAYRFQTPLAVPLMDLTVEKAAMLEILGVPGGEVERFHLEAALSKEQLDALPAGLGAPPNRRLRAAVEAIRYVVYHHPDLVPIGMCIGPFSLMTKLVRDAITPVYLAGAGCSAEEEPEISVVESALEAAVRTITASVRLQVGAGAQLIFVCEPAANISYLSPLQVEGGSDVLDRFVLTPNRRIVGELDRLGVDLLLHDCGELLPSFIRALVQLRPVILSLGSPVDLAEVAADVPQDIVLYGNLPSKKFFSDAEMTEMQVRDLARTLTERMRSTGHPFILGTECDVLDVTGREATIRRKVAALLDA